MQSLRAVMVNCATDCSDAFLLQDSDVDFLLLLTLIDYCLLYKSQHFDDILKSVHFRLS